jgi:hypothetical protein
VSFSSKVAAQEEQAPPLAAPEPAPPEPTAPEPSTPEPSTPEPSTPEPTAPQPADDGLQLPATLAPLSADTSAHVPEARIAPFTLPIHFGHKGEWVIMGSSNSLGISNEKFSDSPATFFSAGGEIGVDNFVADNVSVGFDVLVTYNDDKGYGATALNETKSTALSGGIRFGFNVPLGAYFSWYPRLTLGLQSLHSNTTPVSSNSLPLPPPSSESSVGPWTNFYAPLLFHPASHFLVGFGPRLEHNFGVQRGGPYDGSQSTLIEGQFVVGGWWGGGVASDSDGETDTRTATSASAMKRAEHSFGEQGQIVLTFATDASISHQSFSRSNASETTTNFNPSFDYFVEDDVSIGVDAFIGHNQGTSYNSVGLATQFSSTSRGIAPRLGANVALTQFVSIWLSGELGIGTVDQSQVSAEGTNQQQTTRTWLDFSAPLLAHPTAHFFVGAGPFLFHELSDKNQFNFQNAATSVGAQLLLGGWFAAPGAHPS